MWVATQVNTDAYYLNLCRYTQHEDGWLCEYFDGKRWHRYPEGGQVMSCLEISGLDLQQMGKHPFTEFIFTLVAGQDELMNALKEAFEAYGRGRQVADLPD